MRKQALFEAKQLVRSTGVGVIATHSNNLKGYPFGSVSPYLCDSDGSLYFYISDIAQHAKNLTLDPKMSITIFNQAEQGDQNTQGRVTIVGDTTPVDAELQTELIDKYVRLYPAAESYKRAHDFKLWRLNVKRVRYIGGFGKIFWLEKDEWQAPESPWDNASEQHMIEHMNEDHQDAMALMLKQHFNVEDEQPVMAGVLADGCFLQSKERNFWLDFEQPCENSTDVRKALVKLTHDARAALA
ncbi:HugZ family pyridoxamine 5'-phosphate oxidase [Thalassotalea euphylliae]|uniref:DUF2470 domain-containing protein n=1 Tax=Thalassotalea euphylliae TaxID=1655234 RepID=A0A3E0U1H3_9GAMM|nr:DUF2470 domain-containing protein [Thalassotalea euphylliae]REL30065.1 DUF2470 domain-containing protein [Thalassotalea euphylliae]